MQYSNIKVGDHVDSIRKPTVNYTVIRMDNGWVTLQCMFNKNVAYNIRIRAKSLMSHDDTVRINRAKS